MRWKPTTGHRPGPYEFLGVIRAGIGEVIAMPRPVGDSEIGLFPITMQKRRYRTRALRSRIGWPCLSERRWQPEKGYLRLPSERNR